MIGCSTSIEWIQMGQMISLSKSSGISVVEPSRGSSISCSSVPLAEQWQTSSFANDSVEERTDKLDTLVLLCSPASFQRSKSSGVAIYDQNFFALWEGKFILELGIHLSSIHTSLSSMLVNNSCFSGKDMPAKSLSIVINCNWESVSSSWRFSGSGLVRGCHQEQIFRRTLEIRRKSLSTNTSMRQFRTNRNITIKTRNKRSIPIMWSQAGMPDSFWFSPASLTWRRYSIEFTCSLPFSEAMGNNSKWYSETQFVVPLPLFWTSLLGWYLYLLVEKYDECVKWVIEDARRYLFGMADSLLQRNCSSKQTGEQGYFSWYVPRT